MNPSLPKMLLLMVFYYSNKNPKTLAYPHVNSQQITNKKNKNNKEAATGIVAQCLGMLPHKTWTIITKNERGAGWPLRKGEAGRSDPSPRQNKSQIKQDTDKKPGSAVKCL